MNFIKVEGMVRKMSLSRHPAVPGQRGQSEDETEVVIRSQWQQRAPAGEQGQGVTRLVAHSIADGKRSSALQEISVKKEQVQWRSHCRSFGELGMLAASGQWQGSRFRWPNLITAVPLELTLCSPK